MVENTPLAKLSFTAVLLGPVLDNVKSSVKARSCGFMEGYVPDSFSAFVTFGQSQASCFPVSQSLC